ncbi:MAG TPA: class I SAM-dependent methyltransferase [Alphaproteobacteria bacterium]|nr:class I SAM-dependent methyltransferase [Alphaproteobacteria bacterium]
MQRKAATAERRRFIPLASGTVLEVGVGSGLNLPFYGPRVQRLYALDPSRELWKMARPRLRAVAFPVEYLAASAERIPLEDASVDTVVSTWTLCTIADPLQALAEMRRVLKPKGQLIFVEHGWAPTPGVRAWQDRLTPVWKRIAGGCHLNRPIDALIADAGFEITQIERGYSRGPKLMAYLYKGLAQRPA